MKKFIGLFVLVAAAVFVFGTVSKKADANRIADLGQAIDPAPLDLTIPEVSGDQEKQRDVVSGKSYRNDTSIPLREMRPEPYLGKEMDREANGNPKIPHSRHKDIPDEAVQDKTASMIASVAPLIAGSILNLDSNVFPGLGCDC